MKRILKSGGLLLLLGTVLSGCVKSEVIDEAGPGTNQVQVRFEVELPDVATPAIRGIQNSTETAVTNFYVLIFDSATDQFVDKKIVPAAAITSANGPDNALEIKSFTTALIKSANAADTYNLVLLANIPASGALKTAVDGITVGTPRTTALAALTQTYSGNPTMPVPMASVPKAAVQIQEGMSTLTFDMIRMVARIDVELSASVAADYSVKQVLFYNYNTIGRVWTPNYSGTTTTGTTLPSNPGTSAAGSSYAVANTRSGGLALTDFQALMYAQEATVSAVASRPCIVIELEDATTGASMGFYRADFWSRTGTPQYLDILRNHRYLFTVTAVNGTGFTNANDAYNSTPAGITTEVISIDESEIKEIVVSGNYWLGLSSKSLELDYTAQSDNSLLIKTNVTAGWSVVGVYNAPACTVPHASAWLTSAVKSTDNLAVTATQNPSTTANRTAYVKIQAGTAECVITVVQANKPPVALAFARSNIVMYVSGSDKILTFAETDADLTTDKTVGSVSVPAIPANVQGLHFRWGSLVGVTSNGTSGATFTQNRPVFWPTEYTAPSTWVYNNNGVSVTGQVPYIAGAEIGTQSNEEYDAFVTYNSNTGYDKANAKGDVCRYITDQGWVDGKWRMPTTSEMRMLYNETYAAISNYNGKVIGWDTSHETISNTGTDNKYGYYEIPDVRIVGAGVSSSSTLASPGAGTVVIPASGHRRNSDGMLDFPGFYGYCWSATPSSTAEGAYNLHYTGTTGANPALSSHRTYGFSVRCIQETY